MTDEMIQVALDETLCKSLAWIEHAGFESFDPFDALSSPLVYQLVRKAKIAQRMAIQINRRSPVNLRPILGIRQKRHPMALSQMVRAYVLLSQINRSALYDKLINDLLVCLQSLAIREGGQMGWGLNFPYATRFTSADQTTPNVFTTVNVASGFLEAAEFLGKTEWIDIARKAASFIFEQLGFVEEGDAIWFRYYPGQIIPVPNVTALMAAFLTRLSLASNEKRYDCLISRACLYLAKEQNRDGSWFYARGNEGKWIDGFHTAYIIQSLDVVQSAYPKLPIGNVVSLGKEYYRTNLFGTDGMPKYYSHRSLPIDGQNCAQAIETLAALSRRHPECLPLAYKAFVTSKAALFHDLGGMGYFILERRRFLSNRLYSLRWVQAPMILAMARLVLAGRLVRQGQRTE